MRHHLSTLRIKISPSYVALVFFALIMTFYGCASAPLASALSGSNFQAGHIIDDSVFRDDNTMSVADIQAFLNAKVGTCDTYGSQMYNGSLTRSQYSASVGENTEFTCINGYYENTTTLANNLDDGPIPSGAISAAQIIYNASQEYNINPQVILVTLQKEQGLVTDSWPWNYEYQSAMGYGCPDTAECASQYYGFYNQVSNAAWQFNQYMLNPSAYDYTVGDNYILYSPNSSCGGSVVDIQNAATGALYDYTPYQPDAAALSNLTGTGDSCSSYGNRNFWYYFNTWFGPTISDTYPWAVEEAIGGDGKYWLVVGNTKRWIDSGQIYLDWGLNEYPVQQVPEASLDAIPTIPDLGRLGLMNNGQYVFVDSGQKYNLNTATLADWGYSGSLALAVPLNGLLSTIPTAGNADQFVDVAGSSTNYIMSAGTLYPINPSYVSRWQISSPTDISASSASLFTTSGTTLDYRFSAGGNDYIVDSGQLLNVTSSAISAAYGSIASNFTSLDPSVLPFFNVTNGSLLVEASNSSAWELLIDGEQHYVPNLSTLQAWGIGQTQPQIISPDLLAQFTVGSNLGVTVEGTSGTYYLLDGSKHVISAAVANDWIGSGGASMQLSDSDIIPDSGSTITSPIFQPNGSPNIYTMINGQYYYVQTGSYLNGLGYPTKYDIFNMNSNAVSGLAYGGNVNQFFTNGGTTYYMQDGTAYPLNPTYANLWTAGSTPVAYAGTDFNQRFTIDPSTYGPLIMDSSGTKWAVDNGSLINVSAYADAYNFVPYLDLNITDLPKRSSPGTYLARSSTTPSDTRIWLINKGTKQWIVNAAEYDGYGGNALPITGLSDTFLNDLPTAGEPLPIISTGTSGLKLLVNDQFYGFPDGNTVNNVVGTNGINVVSSSIFNSISSQGGTITLVVRDTSNGKIYVFIDGQLHWLSDSAAYSHYASIPVTNLLDDVIAWFPQGTSIDS